MFFKFCHSRSIRASTLIPIDIRCTSRLGHIIIRNLNGHISLRTAVKGSRHGLTVVAANLEAQAALIADLSLARRRCDQVDPVVHRGNGLVLSLHLDGELMAVGLNAGEAGAAGGQLGVVLRNNARGGTGIKGNCQVNGIILAEIVAGRHVYCIVASYLVVGSQRSLTAVLLIDSHGEVLNACADIVVGGGDFHVDGGGLVLLVCCLGDYEESDGIVGRISKIIPAAVRPYARETMGTAQCGIRILRASCRLAIAIHANNILPIGPGGSDFVQLSALGNLDGVGQAVVAHVGLANLIRDLEGGEASFVGKDDLVGLGAVVSSLDSNCLVGIVVGGSCVVVFGNKECCGRTFASYAGKRIVAFIENIVLTIS